MSLLPPRKQSKSSGTASNETTPLLAEIEPVSIGSDEDLGDGVGNGHVGDNDYDDDDEEEQDEVPLPRTQIFLLCFTAIAGPISFFAIFPYINFMIERVGNVDKAEVGFYSGLIESLFSATQMCVMIFWGKVSHEFPPITREC